MAKSSKPKLILPQSASQYNQSSPSLVDLQTFKPSNLLTFNPQTKPFSANSIL